MTGIEDKCSHPVDRVKFDMIIPYGGYKTHKFFVCLDCGCNNIRPSGFEEFDPGIEPE